MKQLMFTVGYVAHATDEWSLEYRFGKMIKPH